MKTLFTIFNKLLNRPTITTVADYDTNLLTEPLTAQRGA